jgi:hypothetical protein
VLSEFHAIVKGGGMRKFALRLLLLNLIFLSPVFAGEIIQQEIPTFTDQDLSLFLDSLCVPIY